MTVFWCATSAPRVAILSLCACSCACILACSSFRAMLWCAIDPSVYHLGGSGRSICLTSQRSSRYIFILSSKMKDAETSPRTCVSALDAITALPAAWPSNLPALMDPKLPSLDGRMLGWTGCILRHTLCIRTEGCGDAAVQHVWSGL